MAAAIFLAAPVARRDNWPKRCSGALQPRPKKMPFSLGHDVGGSRHRITFRRQAERTFPRIDAQPVAAAVRQLVLDAGIYGDIFRHVVPVGAVHSARLKPARGQEPHELVGKQNIDVGGEDEFAFRPPDAGIFRDHLVERLGVPVKIAAVYIGWDGDDPDGAKAGIGGPAERLYQRRLLSGRIPLDEHQLDWEAVPVGLANQSVYEDL